MPALKEMVDDFLAQKRIAVAGVSRTGQNTANYIYRKLRNAGYQVFPINPNAQSVEGDTCYPDLASIPGGVDGVVIVTQPQHTEQLVRQCAAQGISRVWMHQSMVAAGTSVSPQAVQFCRDNDLTVIAGACPMMFCPPVDIGHTCMRWMLRLTGGLPK